MDKKDLYRLVFLSYKALCAQGNQPGTFSSYCREHGIEHSQMRHILKSEFQDIRSLPGCRNTARLCAQAYAGYKDLCREGRQPGTFASYYRSFGVTKKEMENYLCRRKLRVRDLPGYTYLGFGKLTEPGERGCQEVPFESVIFEESGFLPAQESSIVVKVNGHVEVCFPADTDIDMVAKFIRKMGKEARHVGS